MENEKRLIYAEDLFKPVDFSVLILQSGGKHSGKNIAMYEQIFRKRIEMAPTVDAVEVVRCKDCMWARTIDHREPVDTPRQFICQCFKHHHIPAPWNARLAVESDDFCSYGERRSDGR